jgi:large subunit ribosomal protein L25
MAQTATLSAAIRQSTGKGAARSLRRQGKVPGVIYGRGRTAEPVVVDTLALNKMLIGISAATTIVDVAIEGRPGVRALIREIQRDALRPSDIIHLDLYEIQADEAITLEVPIRLIGIPDGVRNFGGVLDHSLRELEIEVLPADIPEHIDLDVTALTIGHSLFVRDIKPEKFTVLNDPDTPICTVVAPRAEEAPVAAPEEVPTAEPELIRKPKAEAEGEGEADKKA